jgi:hypothetical protein
VPGKSVCGDNISCARSIGSPTRHLVEHTDGWPFAHPAERLAASLSINSGDIVLLAHLSSSVRAGSWHSMER